MKNNNCNDNNIHVILSNISDFFLNSPHSFFNLIFSSEVKFISVSPLISSTFQEIFDVFLNEISRFNATIIPNIIEKNNIIIEIKKIILLEDD